VTQLTYAIQVVPEFLAMEHADARKLANIFYFYNQLKVSHRLIKEAREVELVDYLVGADPSDACTFAYLNSMGISWPQIRIMLEAFPAIVFANADPGFELYQHGTVRNLLREPVLQFLRKRLQIGPEEVFNMIKVWILRTEIAYRSMLFFLLNSGMFCLFLL
jgi:hypothetical protein